MKDSVRDKKLISKTYKSIRITFGILMPNNWIKTNQMRIILRLFNKAGKVKTIIAIGKDYKFFTRTQIMQ